MLPFGVLGCDSYVSIVFTSQLNFPYTGGTGKSQDSLSALSSKTKYFQCPIRFRNVKFILHFEKHDGSSPDQPRSSSHITGFS